jgi:hypothetical protein
MAGYGIRGKKYLGGVLLVVLLGGAGVAWVERGTLLAWFYVRGLARAGEGERDRWVGRVAGLGEAAIPGLLDCLAQPDPGVCRNAREALCHLAGPWGDGDNRAVDLALRLAREFPRLSPAGQENALQLAGHWFPARDPGPAPAAGLVPACARLVEEAAGATDPAVQAAALELCAGLLGQPQGTEALSASRELVRASLRGQAPANRLRAVRLALHPGMDLLEQVVALLNDPEAVVRRAALLAVGPADQVVHDEGLLPSLNDPDPEVRRLCEAALRGRGLRPEHLQLGRLLTHPNPVVRLEVLDLLRKERDLDQGLWLRRLSHDPSPAVRVAAIREMSQQAFLDLSDRIDQMARSDPSPTVCKLAQFYLARLKQSPGPRADR